MAASLAGQLAPLTPETRAIVARAENRRLALMGDQQVLRSRYEEIMRWANPPWDPISRRLVPNPDAATAARVGNMPIHVDLVNPVIDRWAALQAGTPFTFRCRPRIVDSPVPSSDSQEEFFNRKAHEIERAIAQNESTQIEAQTNEWLEAIDFFRTALWAAWGKEAFGKSIVKTGWDIATGLPTAELFEDPSRVYYGWTKRYGRRQIAWAMVVDEISTDEVARRFGLELPIGADGSLDQSRWTGDTETSDYDARSEQSGERSRYLTVQEYWEREPDPKTGLGVRYAFIVAGRVVETVSYPFRRVPFHVWENQHVPTYSHGKSVAETMIPLNAAFDDMLDRQHEVIRFESGPRYKGMNMANSGDEVDLPDPFNLVPLREGHDIQQIDTRVDFFPTQLHADMLFESIYRSTGLTPIAWGMSPNAQTSGRAMAAEWRAVELPLASKLINVGPVVKEIIECWWDYAELYDATHRAIGNGYRRFQILWAPFDIRDKTEKTRDILERMNGNILDPATAIEESGYENSDEIEQRIRKFMTDPVWNPLRYQQLLTLQQLELQIRQMQMQVSAQEQAQGGAQPTNGNPSPEGLAAQGLGAAGQAAQGATGAVGEGENQPGQTPGGGLETDTGILLRTPLEGGIGNQTTVPLGGQSPSAGNVAR